MDEPVFLPISKEDMAARGWWWYDFLLVTGDAYVDHPTFGAAVIGRMLEAAGYQVVDLGRDVPLQRFVDSVREEKPQILALSTLMSTSMAHMGTLIEELKKAGLRDSVKVIVGGAPLSRAFAEKIGADGYSENATEAVKLVDRLLA